MAMTLSLLIIIASSLKLTHSVTTGIRALPDSNPKLTDPPCPPWYTYEDPSKCSSMIGCREPNQLPKELICDEIKGAEIQIGYCITYNEQDGTFQSNNCYYFQPTKRHSITEQGYVALPDNMSELNDYMCHSLNRKGPLCSKCIDGFGPALTSDDYRCSNCTNAWYGIPAYLLVEFLPITVLYLFILTFQISLTSSPIPCFTLLSHMILFMLQYDKKAPLGRLIYQLQGGKLSILRAIYGMTNLKIFQFIVPSFCVSSNLQLIHISLLEYLPAFYPLCLILLTWICVELHGRNFRPFVIAWKPFHRCFVRLRREWSTASDLVDVFASFFLLSYSRIFFQSFLLTHCRSNYIFNKGNTSSISSAYYDPSMPCSNAKHIGLAIIAAITICLFNILPTLLIVLHPIKAFRVCLSKCKLDGIAVTTFVNKFHGCYRNGLNGGKDMRSWSGLYFFLRIILIYGDRLLLHVLPNIWISSALFFVVTALLIAYLKPYRKTYMNVLDISFLAILSLLCLLLSMDHFRAQGMGAYVLTLIPAGLLILFIVYKRVRGRLFLWVIIKLKITIFCRGCCRKTQSNNITQNGYSKVTENDLQQPITTSTVVALHKVS